MTKTCSVAGCDNPRADQSDDATNRHCKVHRSAAQAKYVATTLTQQHGKGFVQGVLAMRECLAHEFEQVGSGNYDGYEIAALIRQAPGPLPNA